MRKKGLLPLILGFLLLTVFALAAFVPEFFTSYSQKELFTKWLPISREHLLGTNAMGYDIFTELIYGARQTLLVGVLSSILTLILGAGMHQRELFQEVEDLLHKDMVACNDGLFV